MIVAAPLAQIDRPNLAREVRRERDVLPLVRRVRERRDEERVAGQRALRALKQLAIIPPPCAFGSRVVFMTMPSCMYIIAPASAMHHLARIERDDHGLKVVANQLVVDFVGHWGSRCSVAGCW